MSPEPREKHTQLLAETFHDEWNTGAPAALARAAAQHARQRRRLRHAAAAIAASAALGVLGFLVAQREPAHLTSVRAPSIAATRGYEIISDEEFLAHLPDRPLLVVKNANGTREFVLLETDPPVESLE